MSEQRFKLSEIYSNRIIDTGNCINNGTHCRLYDLKECVELLNEQQSTISALKEEIEKLNLVIDNIYDSYQNYFGMSLRNSEWLEELDIDGDKDE